MRSIVIAAGVIIAAASAGAIARMRVPPAAGLSGQVVDFATGSPIPRAIVTASGAALAERVGVVADERGEFTFADLPPGRYTVTAEKNAYLTASYGSSRPGRPGTPVTVGADQHISGLIVRLGRVGVITGVIRDQSNEPMSNAQVSAVRWASGSDPPPAPITAATDDRGIYRLSGLSPGEYVIEATVPYVVGGTQSEDGIGMRSTEEVDAILGRLQSGLRGPAPPPAAATSTSPQPRRGYTFAPVFYPGTVIPDDAVRLRVAMGDELRGIDLTLGIVRTSRIDGVILSSDGAPATSAKVVLINSDMPLPRTLTAPYSYSADANADGRFSMTAVPPGQYTLSTRVSVFHPTTNATTGEWLVSFATASVKISGDDVSDVVLRLRPGLTFAGRVVLDSAAGAPPIDFSKLSIELTPTVPVTGLGRSWKNSASSDGRFAVSDIPPGLYRLTSPLEANGWWLRSAMFDGVDILDQPLDLTSSQGIAGAVLTLSNRHSELAGMLQGTTGAATPDYFVIVFPADRSLWRAGSRRVQVTRPATDGAFAFKDLPGGDYFMAPLTDVEPNEWNEPAFLEQLPQTVKVTLRDGESQTIRIQIGPK